jgi:hypothetical protein
VGDVILFVVNGIAPLGVAILADVDSAASGLEQILSNILFTARVWDSVLVSKFINASRVSTFTGAAGSAVDHDLGIERNGSSALVAKEDVESVSQSRR